MKKALISLAIAIALFFAIRALRTTPHPPETTVESQPAPTATEEERAAPPIAPTQASAPQGAARSPHPPENKPTVHLTRFSEAYDACTEDVVCQVEGDPWQEYQELKKDESDEGSTRRLALINYLKANLSEGRYRETTRKIIAEEFPADSQLYYWYMGDFYNNIGDRQNAKAIYDRFRIEFADRPDQIPWSNLAYFYDEQKDFRTALLCYENAVKYTGRREGVRESFSEESLESAYRRIEELKKILGK